MLSHSITGQSIHFKIKILNVHWADNIVLIQQYNENEFNIF